MYKPIEGTLIIGVGHKARQGKDTLATYLISNYRAEKFAFSDALYDVARVVFGMKEKDAPLLQTLGTNVFRHTDPDIWVKTLYYKIKDRHPAIAVIPDVRFPNEADFVKQMGGVLIKVSRLNPDGTQFVTTDRDPNHPSEIALDNYKDWDYEIAVPAGQFSYLYTKADQIITWIEER